MGRMGVGLKRRIGSRAGMALLAVWLGAGAAGAGETPATVTQTLRVDTAIYDVNAGVLQFAFTLANPGDSTAYLDCQVPPRAALEGNTLVLTFSRSATEADGVWAGGPPPGADGTAPAPAVKAEDFPPQRIAGGQSFQGQRRLDRVLGVWEARPKFSALRLKIDVYPERGEGEGPLFVAERGLRVSAPAKTVVRRGKPPVAPKPARIRTPK